MTSLRNKASFAIYAFSIGLNVVAWGLAFWPFRRVRCCWERRCSRIRSACATPSTPTISRRSTTSLESSCRIGKRPVGVGFFFSLGHSTVVVALTVAIALAAAIVKGQLPALQRVGALVGTSVSATFLLLVAAINLSC